MHFKAVFRDSWLQASLFTSQTSVCLYKLSLFQKLKPGERKGSKSSPKIETRSPAKLSSVSISTEVLKCGPDPGSRGLCVLCPDQGKGDLFSEGVEVRENTLEDI